MHFKTKYVEIEMLKISSQLELMEIPFESLNVMLEYEIQPKFKSVIRVFFFFKIMNRTDVFDELFERNSMF